MVGGNNADSGCDRGDPCNRRLRVLDEVVDKLLKEDHSVPLREWLVERDEVPVRVENVAFVTDAWLQHAILVWEEVLADRAESKLLAIEASAISSRLLKVNILTHPRISEMPRDEVLAGVAGPRGDLHGRGVRDEYE